MKVHDDGTIPPPGGPWVFVFGSNLAGIHGAGAALVAHKTFGAKRSHLGGLGWHGSSWAIPTKDKQLRTLPLEEIEQYVKLFISDVEISDSLFFLTRVGCGLAGYSDSQIAPLFAQLVNNPRVSWPKPWARIHSLPPPAAEEHVFEHDNTR